MNFDYNKLLETAGGDEELVGELIDIFMEEYPNYIASIEKAIQENQPQQLHEAAHTLKGSLSSMGANTALDQVIALETMGINKDLQQANIALEQLKHSMEELIQDIKTHERASVK
ncbi:MAG: Hpt domain-containing protein [candidate division Zixibacteria bacterium]|nr:Hpt domain-containing protein [candidate division Zixibacteria bacterium]